MQLARTIVPLTLVMAALATNPLDKVLQLLADTQGKVEKDAAESKTEAEHYAAICKEETTNLGFAIKTGKSEVAGLEAAIVEHTSCIDQKSSAVDGLVAAISTNEKDLKAAQEIRKQDNAEFLTAQTELEETGEVLQRAITILRREMKKGGSFAQLQDSNGGSLVKALATMVEASALSTADATRLTAFMQNSHSQQSDEEDDSLGAPSSAVYESHSGNLVETLEDLQGEAESNLAELRKKETASQHTFELLAQSLTDELKYGNEDMAEAKKAGADCSEKKSKATGDLSEESNQLSANENQLAARTKECAEKKADYESEVKSRNEELGAIKKATEVLQSMTGAAADVSYSLLQRSQLKSSTDLTKFEVVRFLRDLSTKVKSPALTQLTARVSVVLRSSVRGDVFAKVKGLINNLINKLEEEAAAAATEKAFCDKETADNTAKKEKKEGEANKLQTKIDQMSAQSKRLQEEVKAVNKELVDLANTQKQMDKLRQEEAASFASSSSDLKMGIAGVKAAVKALKEFYDSDGHDHDASTSASTGIISLLEVMQGDFEKDLSKFTVIEDDAQRIYEEQTQSNKVATTQMNQDVKYKAKEAASLDKSVSEANADLSGVQEELSAVNAYLEKLTDRCVAKPETYEDRKAARVKEIDGLKEALKILEAQPSLIQSRHFLRGVSRHERA